MARAYLYSLFIFLLMSFTCKGTGEKRVVNSSKVEVTTPDSGYWAYQVYIVDRSTHEVLDFHPELGETAVISYRLTRDGLIRIRLVDYQDTSLLYRTLQDWTYQDYGNYKLSWNGKDACNNLINNKRVQVKFYGYDSLHYYHKREWCHDYQIKGHLAESGKAEFTILSDLGYLNDVSAEVRFYLNERLVKTNTLAPRTAHFSYDQSYPDMTSILRVVIDDGMDHLGTASIILLKSFEEDIH